MSRKPTTSNKSLKYFQSDSATYNDDSILIAKLIYWKIKENISGLCEMKMQISFRIFILLYNAGKETDSRLNYIRLMGNGVAPCTVRGLYDELHIDCRG